MDWKKIIPINQFKRYNNESINKYILITHREINAELKQLSEIHCLYTENERYLLPEKIYKNRDFYNNIVYNYLQFSNELYRICSYGNFSIYTDKYISINEIENEKLRSICKYYYNCNRTLQDMLLHIVHKNNIEKLINIYLIHDDFNIHLVYSHQLPSFNFNQITQQKTIKNIYITYLYTKYLIIYYVAGVFKIKFNNNFYVNDDFYENNDIDILSQYIYKKIDIKIDITLEYIKRIFYTIRSHQLIKTL